MEEKRGSYLNLADFLREKAAQLDHWFYDEDSFPRFFREENDSFLTTSDLWEIEEGDFSSWSAKRSSSALEEVYLVDGRMRVHARIIVGMKVVLLGEVVAGFARWQKDRGLSLGFSPQDPPRLERVLGAPEGLFLGEMVSREFSLGPGFVFNVWESARTSRYPQELEAAQQAIFSAMQVLEGKVVKDLLSRSSCIIKDGTLHEGDPKFRPGVGPCGLVKRVEDLHLPSSYLESLFQLEEGERTPFFSAYLRKDSPTLRVFCYTRLVKRDDNYPWKGLVRLETLLNKERWAGEKDNISLLFDGLVSLLPFLTADFPGKRLPENIFPVIALEEHLGQYLSSPLLVQELVRKALGRKENG